jgi:twitching motility protein PilU
MSKSTEQGMQTFDQALYKLFSSGDITYDAALADSANDLRLVINLGSNADVDPMASVDGLSLEENEAAVNLHR